MPSFGKGMNRHLPDVPRTGILEGFQNGFIREMPSGSEKFEVQPVFLGKAAELRIEAAAARADQETLDALADITQTWENVKGPTIGHPDLFSSPRDQSFRPSLLEMQRQISPLSDGCQSDAAPFQLTVHSVMSQKFYDIKEVLFEFDDRLNQTESMMQAIAKQQMDANSRPSSSVLSQSSIQPRVDSRMPYLMQDNWWQMGGGEMQELKKSLGSASSSAVQEQIRVLRIELEEKMSKLAQLFGTISADRDNSERDARGDSFATRLDSLEKEISMCSNRDRDNVVCDSLEDRFATRLGSLEEAVFGDMNRVVNGSLAEDMLRMHDIGKGQEMHSANGVDNEDLKAEGRLHKAFDGPVEQHEDHSRVAHVHHHHKGGRKSHRGGNAHHGHQQVEQELPRDHHSDITSIDIVADSTDASPELGLCKLLSQMEEIDTFALQRSMWDVSMFLGNKCLTLGASATLAVCLLLNIGVVFLFMALCDTFFTVPEYNDQTKLDFDFWRRSFAHDMRYRNPLTDESLASGVCNENLYLPVSTGQLDQVLRLRAYLAPFVFARAGFLMACLALSVWNCTVLVELRRISHHVSVTLRLPRRAPGGSMTDDSDDGLILAGISTQRRVATMMMLVFRGVQSCLLFLYGNQFLIYTVSVTDLLFNAVALELILRTDELIFEALGPRQAHDLIDSCTVRLKRPRRTKAMYWYGESVVLMCLLFTSVEYYRREGVGPYSEHLRENLDALCGGVPDSLDFVLHTDSLGIPWAAKNEERNNRRDSYSMWVVGQIKESGFPNVTVRYGQRNNIGLVMQVASARDLLSFQERKGFFGDPKAWGSIDIRDYQKVVGWKELKARYRHDFGDADGTVYSRFLQYTLQTSTTEKLCSQVSEGLCNTRGDSQEETMFRQLCPNRCGCNEPFGGTASSPYATSISYGFVGCAAWTTETAAFQNGLRKPACVDTANGTMFRTWAKGLGGATVKAANGSRVLVKDGIVESFNAGGCPQAVGFDLGGGTHSKVCQETTLPSLCPTSCGCDTSQSWHRFWTSQRYFCPSSCGTGPPTCFTIENEDDGGIPEYIGTSYEPDFPCIFPFTYKGKQHMQCITEDWHAPWCYVIIMDDGTNAKWGDCSSDCPGGPNKTSSR